MNSDIFHSRHMKDYISSLHQVLVKNEIITNPKVLKCGQYLSKQKGYLRHRIQCDKIKLCPRCKYRSAPERIQKIISEQKKCLESQKNLFSVSIPKVTKKGIPFRVSRTYRYFEHLSFLLTNRKNKI